MGVTPVNRDDEEPLVFGASRGNEERQTLEEIISRFPPTDIAAIRRVLDNDPTFPLDNGSRDEPSSDGFAFLGSQQSYDEAFPLLGIVQGAPGSGTAGGLSSWVERVSERYQDSAQTFWRHSLIGGDPTGLHFTEKGASRVLRGEDAIREVGRLTRCLREDILSKRGDEEWDESILDAAEEASRMLLKFCTNLFQRDPDSVLCSAGEKNSYEYRKPDSAELHWRYSSISFWIISGQKFDAGRMETSVSIWENGELHFTPLTAGSLAFDNSHRAFSRYFDAVVYEPLSLPGARDYAAWLRGKKSSYSRLIEMKVETHPELGGTMLIHPDSSDDVQRLVLALESDGYQCSYAETRDARHGEYPWALAIPEGSWVKHDDFGGWLGQGDGHLSSFLEDLEQNWSGCSGGCTEPYPFASFFASIHEDSYEPENREPCADCRRRESPPVPGAPESAKATLVERMLELGFLPDVKSGAAMFAGDRSSFAPENVHSLYRYFDRDGRLLYVGETSSPGARFAGHQSKPWISLAVRCDIEHFVSAEEAKEAERWAIREESPIHNKSRPAPKSETRPVPLKI